MTDETVAKVETVEEPAQEASDWGTDPMIKSLAALKDSIVAGKEIRAKLARAEATIKAQIATINELVNEKVQLKARTSEAEDIAQASATDAAQLRANLDYEKELFVTLNREHDELKEAHRMLLEDHGKARDERDLAVMDREETQKQLDNVAWQLGKVSAELDASRGQWFKQEDDLQRSVRDLTAERNSFEEKFRKCKSLAASMMALDQVKPVAEEPQYN